LGANPPFQRVEETTGVCKKARLFAIVMGILLQCSKLRASKCKKFQNPGASMNHSQLGLRSAVNANTNVRHAKVHVSDLDHLGYHKHFKNDTAYQLAQ